MRVATVLEGQLSFVDRNSRIEAFVSESGETSFLKASRVLLPIDAAVFTQSSTACLYSSVLFPNL